MNQKDHVKQANENRDAIGRATESLLADYRATFGAAAGQRVLAHLRHSAGCGKPAYLPTAGGLIDPYATHVRVGRQSIVDEITEHLATPEDGCGESPAAIK